MQLGERRAHVLRKTLETEVDAKVNLDGESIANIDTSIPFLNHMISQLSRHGNFDIDLRAKGDIDVDFHHLVEDVGITLGQAFNKSLEDKVSINRFGYSMVPLDEALAQVVVDISGRPFIVYNVPVQGKWIGLLDAELFEDFFRAFSLNAQICLHASVLYGKSTHHVIESLFKSLALSLRMAVNKVQSVEIPSTKGII